MATLLSWHFFVKALITFSATYIRIGVDNYRTDHWWCTVTFQSTHWLDVVAFPTNDVASWQNQHRERESGNSGRANIELPSQAGVATPSQGNAVSGWIFGKKWSFAGVVLRFTRHISFLGGSSHYNTNNTVATIIAETFQHTFDIK